MDLKFIDGVKKINSLSYSILISITKHDLYRMFPNFNGPRGG